MKTDTVKIAFELEPDDAWEYAQFLKRVCRESFRQYARNSEHSAGAGGEFQAGRDLHRRNAVLNKPGAARAGMTVMGKSGPAVASGGMVGAPDWGGPGWW
jgi:hypothetical protein